MRSYRGTPEPPPLVEGGISCGFFSRDRSTHHRISTRPFPGHSWRAALRQPAENFFLDVVVAAATATTKPEAECRLRATHVPRENPLGYPGLLQNDADFRAKFQFVAVVMVFPDVRKTPTNFVQ